MSDLERRLREGLERLPEPPADAGRRAERAALARLPGSAPRRSRRRRVALLAAAGLAAAAAGAGLAATDRLDVRLGAPAADAPARAGGARAPAALPAGVDGLAVVADGRLTLRTRAGLGIRGLAVSAAELSPNARYAAVGIGSALVAMAPDGRRAWSHAAGGAVTAIAWAPNPIVLAYVVRRGPRHELRVIEGDGDGDRLVDRSVAPVRPSWRDDALALAYVDAGGAGRLAAYPSLAAETLPVPAAVTAVAFAPAGDRLALALRRPRPAVAELGPGAPVRFADVGGHDGRIAALAWAGPRELLVAGSGGEGPGRLWSLAVSPGLGGKPRGVAVAEVAGLARGPGGRVVAAERRRGEVRVVRVAALPAGGDERLRGEALLTVRATAGAGVSLSVR